MVIFIRSRSQYFRPDRHIRERVSTWLCKIYPAHQVLGSRCGWCRKIVPQLPKNIINVKYSYLEINGSYVSVQIGLFVNVSRQDFVRCNTRHTTKNTHTEIIALIAYLVPTVERTPSVEYPSCFYLLSTTGRECKRLSLIHIWRCRRRLRCRSRWSPYH